MPFWNRKREDTIDRQVLVKGGRKLAKYANDFDFRPRSSRPLPLDRGGTRVSGGPVSNRMLSFSGNSGDFYRWMRDSIPIISAGVWAWVRLCATETSLHLFGSGSERLRAESILAALDQRILESPYGRGSGLTRLVEACFLELFTVGKFAGEAILSDDRRSIDHFRFIDPYRVGWEHTESGWTPFLADENGKPGEVIRLDPRTFFYSTLGTDVTNPAGIEPLAAIPFVTEVAEVMLDDMARSSHNAGTPRLQVKIGRPERFSWEGDQDYTDRANRFFEQVVSQFDHLEPDDNVFTWNDVELTVVGGSGKQWEWRLNRDQVVEDVITGLKLYPWVLGRTQKTTTNWVQTQFDLLMQMVAGHQRSGAGLLDWLCNLELELQGVKATARNSFSTHPDPFRLERAKAAAIEFDNLDRQVERGYITKDDAARRLGLPQAARKDADGG